MEAGKSLSGQLPPFLFFGIPCKCDKESDDVCPVRRPSLRCGTKRSGTASWSSAWEVHCSRAFGLEALKPKASKPWRTLAASRS